MMIVFMMLWMNHLSTITMEIRLPTQIEHRLYRLIMIRCLKIELNAIRTLQIDLITNRAPVPIKRRR